MSPNQISDLPFIYMIGLIGLLAGGLASYIANLLLCDEGFTPIPKLGAYCNHRGTIIEAIPFVSLLLLENKCDICRNRIKWQYLLVEIFMSCVFVALALRFGISAYLFGMMFFVAVLVAICITDFKAKIIPHELTYPAILAGIVFSATLKMDLLGALAGIGMSYILFDFLAFYGLKVYLWFYQPTLGRGKVFISAGDTKPAKIEQKERNVFWLSKELTPPTKEASHKRYLVGRLFSKGVPLEELEVIGGGDAVLSALISAWLGWQKLVFTLVLGFMIGTVLGAIYVLVEICKERLLKTVIAPILWSAGGLTAFAAFMLSLLAISLKESILLMPYQYILPGAVLIGCLLGLIIAGSKISKPFPFGPALAIAALIAVFKNEN